LPTVLLQPCLDLRIGPVLFCEPHGSFIAAPGNVALTDAQHGFRQGERELRVRAATHPPHPDDAEDRLVKWYCFGMGSSDRLVPTFSGADVGNVLTVLKRGSPGFVFHMRARTS